MGLARGLQAGDDDPRSREAGQILGKLRAAMASDEIVTAFAPALQAAADAAFDWALRGSRAEPPVDDVVRRRVRGHTREVLAELREFLDAHPHDDVEITWRVMGE